MVFAFLLVCIYMVVLIIPVISEKKTIRILNTSMIFAGFFIMNIPVKISRNESNTAVTYLM